MDLELIFIGLFALFGCVFFLLFLACFQRALQPGPQSSRYISDHGDEELAQQSSFIPSSGDVDDGVLLTGTAHNPLATLSKSTLAPCQYSNNLYFMKRLSRSLTAERSALIMPCILREFSIEEVEAATAKFASSNIIKHGHSGDIYKGVLEGGEVVVIKRVMYMQKKNTSNKNCSKGGYNLDNMLIMNKDYYAAEMDVYGKVLDRSFLVPMLGQCLASQEEKFLVYEHMPYGDLASILAEARATTNVARKQAQPIIVEEAEKEDDGIAATTTTTTNTIDSILATNSISTRPKKSAIYSDAGGGGGGGAKCRAFTWPMRMRIARQVAEALVYLHHESRPPLSHRNIQGSSVLLNKDFEVKLGSLGDAQKIESGELPVYDIYCFGRLLLDLISGLDISGNGRSDEAVQAWISSCFHALTTTTTTMSSTSLPPPSLPCKELPHINTHRSLLNVKLIDKNLVALVQEHHLLEIIQVAQLAKLCMEPTTLQKLSMKGVLQMLPSSNKMP